MAIVRRTTVFRRSRRRGTGYVVRRFTHRVGQFAPVEYTGSRNGGEVKGERHIGRRFRGVLVGGGNDTPPCWFMTITIL